MLLPMHRNRAEKIVISIGNTILTKNITVVLVQEYTPSLKKIQVGIEHSDNFFRAVWVSPERIYFVKKLQNISVFLLVWKKSARIWSSTSVAKTGSQAALLVRCWITIDPSKELACNTQWSRTSWLVYNIPSFAQWPFRKFLGSGRDSIDV